MATTATTVTVPAEEAKKPKKKVDWKALPEVWAMIRPRKAVLLLGFLLMAINRLAALVLPGSTKYLIEDVIGK